MKKISYLILLLIPALMLGSCNDDDPTTPEVIDSTVQDSGMDAAVSVTPTPDGTTFSYKSWVEVNQVFAGHTNTDESPSRVSMSTSDAGTGTKISVVLTNKLKHVVDTVTVNHYKFAENPVVSIERKTGDSYPEGNYITITDSILVYKLDYGNFVEKFELLFQVATYNDGVTRFKLPYKQYGGFSVKDYRVENKDSRILNDGTGSESSSAYALKIFTQSLQVDFNDREYTVNATYNLKRRIATPGNVYIVRSEIVEKSIELLRNDDGVGAEFISKMKVHQVWSDGRDETVEYSAQVFCQIGSDVSREIEVHGDPSETEVQHMELYMVDDTDPWSVPDHPDFNSQFIHTGELVIYYPGWNLNFDLHVGYAFYDDGVTYDVYLAPEFNVENIRVASQSMTLLEPNFYQQNAVIEADVRGTTIRHATFITLKFDE